MQKLKKLWKDNRGIEGLPIRLVIALVVGVASLAIMTSILGGLPTFESTEVTVEYDNASAQGITGAEQEITASVVTDTGEPVQNARIVVSGGTSSLQGDTYVAQANADSNNNNATFSIADESYGSSGSADVVTDLRSDQNKGTLQVEVQPPSDGDYVDEQENPEILVTR